MKPYLKYKDSGIEWIGEIPEHWEVTKLKYSDKVIMGQSPNSDDYNDTNEGLPFLQGNADFKTLFPKPKVWCETANKIAEKEDVLLSVRAPIGAVNIADQSYGIGRGLCAIRSKKSLAKLLFYLALSLNDELNSIGTGSTYTAVSIDDIANVFIPFIPSIEQQTIANYLDRKTHLIDTFVENKQKLIDLLKEQRAAIINQVVTKGLNPDVKLKDSGIEWLGEIPEHWARTHIKYIGAKHRDAIVDGPFGSSVNVQTDYVDKGIPVIRTINISNTGFVENGLRFIRNEKFEQLSRHAVYPNDVLLSKVGTIGNTCLFPPHIPKGMLSTTGSCKITTDKNLMIPKYLVYLFQSMKEHFMLLASSNVQPFLNMGTIRNIRIPLLPIEDQKIIVENIEIETGKIDNTIEKIEKKIKLLKEYRTALISEVVTGKIDVRDSGIQEVRPS